MIFTEEELEELTDKLTGQWDWLLGFHYENGSGELCFSYINVETGDMESLPIWRAPIVMKREVDSWIQKKKNTMAL